jgi:hypothetical protein
LELGQELAWSLAWSLVHCSSSWSFVIHLVPSSFSTVGIDERGTYYAALHGAWWTIGASLGTEDKLGMSLDIIKLGAEIGIEELAWCVSGNQAFCCT